MHSRPLARTVLVTLFVLLGLAGLTQPAGAAGRHVCDQRLHVSDDAGRGQSSTRVQGPPDLKRIESAVVGFDPPQTIPAMR